MAPINVSEASTHLRSAVTEKVAGESRLSGPDSSEQSIVVFEHAGSGLLLDDPDLGFPGGSLFPVLNMDTVVNLVNVDAGAQAPLITDVAEEYSSLTTKGTLLASSSIQDDPTRPQPRTIAPKVSDNHTHPLQVQAGVRKPVLGTKRAPFKTKLLKIETSLTRTLNSCIRCRVLRNRCPPNLEDLDGPCLTCMRIAPEITRLPCLRYKITESNLYRTTFQYYEFFRLHLMVGSTYGDFYIKRRWTQNETKVLQVAQDSNVILKLRVREFIPTAEELLSDDTRGNKVYDIPWAIIDPDEATKAINLYIDRCIETYLYFILDDSNHLVWDIFQWAIRLSELPEPNILLSNVIRIWVVCRFLEGRWRCTGEDIFGTEGLSHYYDRDPIVQVPPYINYQMAAVFTERILEPLRIKVLKQLQDLVLANKTRNWFVISLSVFILLHNYELQCRFHRAFARRRGFSTQFVDMHIIRAIHSGAKTILAHFHYICKGQRPFSPDSNWDSPEMKKMAQLDDEQICFLKQYQDLVQQNGR